MQRKLIQGPPFDQVEDRAVVEELARMAGAGSDRTGPCERERKAARGWWARPGAPEGHGAEGGGGCLQSGILAENE
jgi:hypothetical protein